MANGIAPNFKDQEEKNIVMATIGITILLSVTCYFACLAPLIVYFGLQDKLSNVGREIIRRFTNFEILITIACILLSITVVGIPVMILVGLFGLIISIIALFAVINNTEVNIPVFVELIKESAITPITPSSNQENKDDELKP